MKLSICIVNWNVSDLLKKCLQSIYKNPPSCDFEVIVVDNASSDDSLEMIEKFYYRGVRVLENKKNLGFSTANNQAIMISKGEYILLLNPDTEVMYGSFDKLIEFLDKDPDTGIVAPKLLNPDGSLQRSCLGFPTLSAMAARQLFIEQIWPNNPATRAYLMADFKYDKTQEVDQPMGACMLVRKVILDEVGLFDENSFMFFDEVDLCFRIKKAGWKIFFTPDAEIIHHGGTSIKKWGFHNLSRHWTCSRNYFFKKNYGDTYVILLSVIDLARIIIIALILVALIRLIIKGLLMFSLF